MKIACGFAENEVEQLQKYSHKKLTRLESLLEKKSTLCDKNSLRYANLLLVVFFSSLTVEQLYTIFYVFR